MSARERYDLRLKRLVAIETAHRHAIRQAEEGLRRDGAHRTRYERTIAKHKRKIDKLLPKIRNLRELRASRK